MALSEKTLEKLKEESVEAGGKVYEDTDYTEEDVTHFDEDDDPQSHAGEFDEEVTD